MKRIGQVIKLRPEKIEAYKALHLAVWPSVLATLTQCNIRNFSIYLRNDLLFGYFEYVGDCYAEDMERIARDPVTQQWWTITDSCQLPIDANVTGQRWAEMEELFHLV